MIFQRAHSLHTASFSHYFFGGRLRFDASFHTDFEVLYVLSGSLRLMVDQRTFTVEPGDFELVLPNQVHATLDSTEDTVVWFADFSPDLIPSFATDLQGHMGERPYFSGRGTPAEAMLKPILLEEPTDFGNEIIPGPRMGSKYEVQALLYAICAEYVKQVRIVPETHPDNDLSARVAQYISENFRENLSLSSVASALNYDVFYLSRCFNQALGMSFKQYLNACRINMAKQLVHDTDRRITDIAAECGFQSIRTFNHVFQSQTGLTPTAYRTQTAHQNFAAVDPSISLAGFR